MRTRLFVLCVSVMFCAGFSCSRRQEKAPEPSVNGNMLSGSSQQPTPKPTPKISSEEAVSIAKSHFSRIEALNNYEIRSLERVDGWRVEFRHKNKAMEGGPVIYSIDKETGKILDLNLNQ